MEATCFSETSVDWLHGVISQNIDLFSNERYYRRPRDRWEDDIKMDRKEIGRERVDLIYLVQKRPLLNAVMEVRGLYSYGSFLNRRTTVSLSRWTHFHEIN
jgi:hypothetical protein